MDTSANHEFVVVKKSFTFATCAACNGLGVRKRKFRKMIFTEDCPDCLGKGRRRFAKTEEVPLSEALNEVLNDLKPTI